MMKTTIAFAIILFCTTLIILASCQLQKQQDDVKTPENLYRTTVAKWRRTNSWEPWHEYTHHLLSHLHRQSASINREKDGKIEDGGRDSTLSLLDIVAALEEGILAIEKATVARGDGANPKRDATLSILYDAYGQALMALDDGQCHALALDPHTLLIGVETVLGKDSSEGSNSSSFQELCIENAENALRNAVTLDATNIQAEKHLEKVLQLTHPTDANAKDVVHRRKSKEFVAELFDSFADTFDEKLVHGLGYKVPQLIGDAVRELGQESYGAALDAGCGTGLAGRLLKPFVKDVLVGVDASPKMLKIASKCSMAHGCGSKDDSTLDGNDDPLYDKLMVMDLEEMTLENTLQEKNEENDDRRGFDLIVAADVLVYFGSITNLLKTFSQVSNQDARLLFTTERTSEEEAPLGWRLLPSGRFAHTKRHVDEAAQEAGYTMVLYREIVPRMERGEPVQGHLFGFVLKTEMQTVGSEL